MKNIRYILTGINRYRERKEMVVKVYPDSFTKNYFAYLYGIKVVTVYKAKLDLLEKEEI